MNTRAASDRFHIMYLYNRLSEDPGFDMHPRTFIFGAKAASGVSYGQANNKAHTLPG